MSYNMKNYFYLLGISLAAFFIILLIFHFGDIPNKHNNGFKRNYILKSYSATHEMSFPDTLYEIIGSTRSNIYIDLATQGEILEVDRSLHNKIRRIKIPFFAKFYDSLQFSSLEIKIDSPSIYLFAENKPAIVKTNFDATLFEIRMLPPGAFTREVMVSDDCFILRKIEPRLIDQLFVRYNFSTGALKKEDNISPIYGDGGIISDGQLQVDAETKRLYYIYYYKNLLLSFDTSLNVVKKFSSIDTTGSFAIKTGLVKNGGTTAYANITPANIINKVNYVQSGLLFNMSSLRADNETEEFFSTNSILDIIDLKNGNYLGSMRLPAFKGSKLSRFIISNNQLIALYTKSIVIYDLNPDLNRQDQ